MSGARRRAGKSWFRATIAGKITARMSAVAAVPVLVVGGLTAGGLFALADRADDTLSSSRIELASQGVGDLRSEQASLFLGQLDRLIGERFDDLIDWSRDDLVIGATVATYEGVDEIAALAPPVIEARLDAGDQLDGSGITPRYLSERVGDGSTFTSARLTDQNGFTLGTTNPGDDFLHAHQNWWRAAWNDGAYLGAPVVDSSTGSLVFDIAVRVDGHNGDRPSGVIHATLDAAALQGLADEFADVDDDVDLWMLTEDGRLVVETASDHDPGRLGTMPSFRAGIAELYRAANEGGGAGVHVSDSGVGGYGWSSQARSIERLGTEIATPRLLAFTEQPLSAAMAPLGPLDRLGADLDSAAITMTAIVVALVAAALLAAFWVSRLLADQITEPLRTLGAEARRMSESELPSLVHTLRSTDGSGEVPVVDLIDVDADDEVGELASAFNALRATTVELAATQAIDRSKDLAGVLVDLGRRNQHLIGRQLEYIDRLEATEADPDVLEKLFTLDLMATRMRRNAESLLVLAGEHVPSQTFEPQPVHQVLRAATSEVEHFTRVELVSLQPALIEPSVVNDLTHMLAELIENATNFSPMGASVEIVGSWDARDRYTISVVDRGRGLSRLKLAEANARISQTAFDETPTSRLGLFVVGRLAARHGIDARLVESAGVGTTAKVTLPSRWVSVVDHPVDEIVGSRLSTSTPAASISTMGAQWPLPQRVSLPVPAPERASERAPMVPAPIGSGPRPEPLTIDEIEEALELPAYRLPTEPGDQNGQPGAGVANPVPAPANGAPQDTAPQTWGDTEATSSDETVGLPIPPFQARASRIPGVAAEPGRVPRPERSHPSNPAFRHEGRATPGGHLEIVGTPPEVDAEARAIEVRDRLGRFTQGVAAAKANGEGDGDGGTTTGPTGRTNGRNDVVAFRPRPKAEVDLVSAAEEEPS